jgi:hypothetical protein
MLPTALSAHPIENMTSSNPREWLCQFAGIAKPPEPQEISIRWWILVNSSY